ncbi:MAG TPA: nucleotidyltransferase family protein [Vineibacter sp.]|nr:nucleotidyltransferase family protein [Vineibacter sp.]
MIRSRYALDIVCHGLRPDGPTLTDVTNQAWREAIAIANEHLVAPALYAALAGAGRLDELPSDVRDYLGLLHHGNTARNDSMRQQALELLGALADAGIDALLLKGGATLFLDGEAEQSGRMFRDLDVLVPWHAADQVFAVLETLGYGAIARYPAGHHAYGDFARPGDPAAVDLHFELIDTPHVLPARDVWRRATAITAQGTRFFVPSPTDRVLHNVLHAQVHFLGNYYRGIFELRQLNEFAMFARRESAPAIDWITMADTLSRQRLRAPLYAYALLAHRLLGAPWTLPEPAPAAAQRHVRYCLLQHCVPALGHLRTPVANIRSAFAPHRMDELYGHGDPLMRQRLHHAARFMRKGGAGDWIARLLRSEAHPRGWRR